MFFWKSFSAAAHAAETAKQIKREQILFFMLRNISFFPVSGSPLFGGGDVIALNENVGYGRAAHVGFLRTTTPYALLLNPDLVATTSDVEQLFAAARRQDGDTALWSPETHENVLRKDRSNASTGSLDARCFST